MIDVEQQPRVAILIFADGQQRDLRRRGFSPRVGSLLSLPKLNDLRAPADLHWFCDQPVRGLAPSAVTVHRQSGRTFAQRLENAAEELARRGYDKIVIVGRDCPQLTSDDVSRAIELLDSRKLVIGPDHRGGCWLIALHVADRARLRGIRWQQDTDAAELLSRFGEADSTLLETKFDLDHADDLRNLARVFTPAAALLSFAIAADWSIHRFTSHTICFIRLTQQIPPPVMQLAA